MSREYVYLSFFKSNKVDYTYHSRVKIIEFACIYCYETAVMNSKTSEWRCSNCSESGNLVTLINYAQNNSFGKIFTPRKEQQSIFNMLEQLSNKYPKEKSLLLVTQKIKGLIKYYENQKTPYSL